MNCVNRVSLPGLDEHPVPVQFAAVASATEPVGHPARRRQEQLPLAGGERHGIAGGGQICNAAGNSLEQRLQALTVGDAFFHFGAGCLDPAIERRERVLFPGSRLDQRPGPGLETLAIPRQAAVLGLDFGSHVAQPGDGFRIPGNALGAGPVDVVVVSQDSRQAVRVFLIEQHFQVALAAHLPGRADLLADVGLLGRPGCLKLFSFVLQAADVLLAFVDLVLDAFDFFQQVADFLLVLLQVFLEFGAFIAGFLQRLLEFLDLAAKRLELFAQLFLVGDGFFSRVSGQSNQ